MRTTKAYKKENRRGFLMKKALSFYRSGLAAFAWMAAGSVPAMAAPLWCQQIDKGVFCAAPEAKVPDFCGTKPISVALADGFADNAWRQMTTGVAINEASRCPNVTSWTHTDGQGNTQKAISDIEGLAARGISAIAVYPDAGPALLPALRDAFRQGSAIVPFTEHVGGKPGVDYTAFFGTDFHDDGYNWGTWLIKALHGSGTVAYLGGPPGSSQGIQTSKGLHDAFAGHSGMKMIGQQPFEVTNFDPSLIAKVEVALIARYPVINAIGADLTMPVITSGAFPRAGRPLPLIVGEDANGLGCAWKKLHAQDPNSSFQYMTMSGENWIVRLALERAIASAAGGKMDQPLVIADTTGNKRVVWVPGKKLVNFVFDDSLAGHVICDPKLPPSAGNGTSLTEAQTLAALKGGL
jgi:ribose transport system substrate-binding protein